ncbi:MAG: hypothetical protein ALAOOOJD_02929 [bacterium]|nr:hypothetical protein [bacterium]
MQKNKLAFVMFLQRKKARRLPQLLAFLNRRRLDLIANVGIKLCRGNDAIAFLLNFGIRRAGQPFKQRQRKRRMRQAPIDIFYAAITGGFALQHIQRFLIVSRRSDHLPGRILHKAVEAFFINFFRHQRADGAKVTRPLKRPGKAAIQNEQQMPARQRVQAFM